MRRKVGIRTYPWPAAEEDNPALPPPPPPPLPVPVPVPLEDEGIPAAKRPRLQTPTSFATALDGVTTDPPDDTFIYPVTPAAPLPSAATSREPRRNWTGEEDAKLTEAVKKHGKIWVAVAAMVPDRTNDQCRERWVHTVDPVNGNKGKPRRSWTGEEGTKLTEAVKKHGNKWVAVATLVPGRTNQQCHKRWTQALDPANGLKGRKWTGEEDAKLTEAVKKHGKNWVAVATLVPGRTDSQCRARWVKCLDPDRASNTAEEEHNDGNDEALMPEYLYDRMAHSTKGFV
jgi:hypothetical protein